MSFSINVALLGVSLAFGLAICESFARVMETKSEFSGSVSYQQHDTLGFMATPGTAIMKTGEFETSWDINEYGMNDDPIDTVVGDSGTRIMVLGDSHTFAIGVSRDETWPMLLREQLFNQGKHMGTVYNCSSVGYSLSQYLLKYRQMRRIINPDILIVGFSMATDLYDLIPPRMGGFVYGAHYGRVYHDLDSEKNLLEKYDLVGLDLRNLSDISDVSENTVNWTQRAKSFLISNSALFRMLKSSNLAMWIAVNYRVGGKSLWPGLDTCLKIELSEDDQYRWDLAEQLIAQLAKEAHNEKVKVILVNIPYLAVVYDDVWENSFGSREDIYDRFITSRRLERICEANDISFVNCTPFFIDELKETEEWLHFRKDKHPNAKGHQVIAEGLYDFILHNQMLNALNRTSTLDLNTYAKGI